MRPSTTAGASALVLAALLAAGCSGASSALPAPTGEVAQVGTHLYSQTLDDALANR